MPHLFTNRLRLHDLTGRREDLRRQFMWETINAVVYKLGGAIFVAGSILFFPSFDAYADLGALIFLFGSILYLVVTGHDMIEAARHWRGLAARDIWARLELVAAVAYVLGTVLFCVGSVLFLSWVGLADAGAWCFVSGSLMFVLGACINVLQIVQAASMVTLQLMNLTAVCFVVGSVLFVVASVPYLWTVAPRDRDELYAFLAWQYLAGSALFLAGGVFNYWRAYIFMRDAMRARRLSGQDPALGPEAGAGPKAG